MLYTLGSETNARSKTGTKIMLGILLTFIAVAIFCVVVKQLFDAAIVIIKALFCKQVFVLLVVVGFYFWTKI